MLPELRIISQCGILFRKRILAMSMRGFAFIALGTILAVSLNACASVTDQSPRVTPTLIAPSPTRNSAVTPSATVPHVDIVLTPASQRQTTTAKVGQIINVPDMPEFEWNVSYRSEILLALTPPDQMNQPGSAGWFFRVIAPGNTTVVLTSIAPPCLGGTPCPPNILRLEFPIEALP